MKPMAVEPPVTATHRFHGAIMTDAFLKLPYFGHIPIGVAVSAYFPTILALVEAAFNAETGAAITIPADEQTVALWTTALADFLRTSFEGIHTRLDQVPATEQNAKVLAMRFANDQLRTVVLPAHFAAKRYQLFVVENGLHRQFAQYPSIDRLDKADELAGANLRTGADAMQRAARPGQLRRMGVGAENRPYRSVTSDQYLYST